MPWSNIPPELTPKAERIYKRLRAKGMDKSKASAIMYTTLKKMGKLKESAPIQEGLLGTLAFNMGRFGAVAKRGASMLGARSGKVGQFVKTKWNNLKNTSLFGKVKDKIGAMKENPFMKDKMDALKNSTLGKGYRVGQKRMGRQLAARSPQKMYQQAFKF